MQFKHKQHSPSRSIISLVMLLGAAGCSGDDRVCGSADAPADGLTLMIDGQAFTYGGATSSPNNDCTPVQGQEPTSLTVDLRQLTPTPPAERLLVLCLPRPDALGEEPIAIPSEELVQLIDIFAEADDCFISLDRSASSTGTATFIGFCDAGSHPDGYALELEGSFAGTRTCEGQAMESVRIELDGRVAVNPLL